MRTRQKEVNIGERKEERRCRICQTAEEIMIHVLKKYKKTKSDADGRIYRGRR